MAASAALAGCGAHRQATLAPATTPSATRAAFGTADWYCLNAGERREMFMLRGSGHDLLAALTIGTGQVAVVLAHHVSGSLCQWWPYARSLAAVGYRVVAFDFDGCGASPLGDGDYPGDNRRLEPCSVCPRGDSRLTYMTPVTITTEFTLASGGAR